MKDLKQYIECEGGGGAMPSNTLGAGNPGLVGPSTLSEPLTQGEIAKQPTAKVKKEKFSTSINKKKKRNMKDLKEQLNESLEKIEEARTNGCCVWQVYDRGGDDNVKTAKFFAKDLYEAVYKLVQHCHFYFFADAFTDPEYDDDPETTLYVDKKASKAERDEKAMRAIARIENENGDGCDFVYTFEWNGKTYIDNGSPEEIW